jgi:hypothetical protein
VHAAEGRADERQEGLVGDGIEDLRVGMRGILLGRIGPIDRRAEGLLSVAIAVTPQFRYRDVSGRTQFAWLECSYDLAKRSVSGIKED